MRDYPALLRQSACEAGNILCLGLDPDPARIAKVEPGPPLQACRRFLARVLEAITESGVRPAAWKPNLAYFEQFGSAGLAWLEELRPTLSGPVILDAKRGDIGASSQAYARALFDVWGADAVTVNPWMGRDSVQPFLDYGGGVYLLVRTSNPGSAEMQTVLTADGVPMWEALLGKILSWPEAGGRLGGVVGATQPEALEHLGKLLGDRPFPLLIPGVGSQGGEAAVVMTRLPGERALHRVNVSSAILYAFEKSDLEYGAAAADALGRYASQMALAG